MGVQLLLPLSMNTEPLLKRAHEKAREVAVKLSASVEPLKPRHLYGEQADNYGYTLRLGELYFDLPDNSRVVVFGVYNADEYFDYLVIRDGETEYEWFVEPVNFFPERMGVWGGDPIILRKDTGSLFVHTTSTDENKDRVFGWLLAFAVVPRVQPPPATPPRRPRERRRRRR